VNLFRKAKQTVEHAGGIIKGWLDLSGGYKSNWWQIDAVKPDTNTAIRSSGVYACVATLAQEVARLDVTHYSNPDLSGQEEMYNSHLTRLLNKPNSYQTRSDFFLYVMYSLLMNGNSYCLMTRDTRGRVIDMTPLNPRAVQPYVTEDGAIYYSIAQLDINPGAVINNETFIPQRNMLHIRLFTPTHPLIGISPLTACAQSVSLGLNIQVESGAFFANQSKPSGILRTPKPLTPEQAKRLRDAWVSGTTGINAGKVPVLDNDLQFQQMSLSAAEAQLIEQYGMTKKDIAIVYRIPLYMVGEGDATFKTAEASQRDFITRSLGFYIEHIENSLDQFFGFNGRTESIEFEVERGIMRPEYISRIEGLTKGVQGGIFAPNEARKSEGLPGKGSAGDELYMQRQNVPIDMLGEDVLAMGGDGSSDSSDDSGADNDTDTDDTASDTDKMLAQADYYETRKLLFGKAA